jgi:hypothetical protein
MSKSKIAKAWVNPIKLLFLSLLIPQQNKLARFVLGKFFSSKPDESTWGWLVPKSVFPRLPWKHGTAVFRIVLYDRGRC